MCCCESRSARSPSQLNQAALKERDDIAKANVDLQKGLE